MKKILTLACLLIAIPACSSSPALTETTTSTSVAHPATGGEVHRSSTETREVAADGAATTETTETTTTSTPPPK